MPTRVELHPILALVFDGRGDTLGGAVALTAEQNRRMTEVGPGTPMGELLRRHWHPVAAVDQFSAEPKRAIRVLGEDLVLYRMPTGEYGVIERHCPHRRADFVNGYVEDDGIRCSYHGWKFDSTGQCVQQPYEEQAADGTRFRDRICAVSYKAEARYGLVWVYMGPGQPPLIPAWEPFTVENCYAQIVFHEVNCNWLQCQENSNDPVHFEWLHDNWPPGRAAPGGVAEPGEYRPTHVELGFDEWDHGFIYRRLKAGEDESADSWVNGRVAIVPNLFAPVHFEWRVPIDDERTLSVVWVADRVITEREPFAQTTIHSWSGVTHDEDGRPLDTHVLHQDVLSWEGQGVIADRTKENLGRSDRGVQMMRNRLEADMAAVERGEDPSGIIRDGGQNDCVKWPTATVRHYTEPKGRDEVAQWSAFLHRLLPTMRPEDHFFLIEGQPDHVRAEWDYLMGLSDSKPSTLADQSGDQT